MGSQFQRNLDKIEDGYNSKLDAIEQRWDAKRAATDNWRTMTLCFGSLLIIQSLVFATYVLMY